VLLAITFLARMAMWGAIFGGGGGDRDNNGGNIFGLLAMVILAPIASRTSIPKTIVSAGTTMIPPPTPARAPIKPAPMQTRKIPRSASTVNDVFASTLSVDPRDEALRSPLVGVVLWVLGR